MVTHADSNGFAFWFVILLNEEKSLPEFKQPEA